MKANGKRNFCIIKSYCHNVHWEGREGPAGWSPGCCSWWDWEPWEQEHWEPPVVRDLPAVRLFSFTVTRLAVGVLPAASGWKSGESMARTFERHPWPWLPWGKGDRVLVGKCETSLFVNFSLGQSKTFLFSKPPGKSVFPVHMKWEQIIYDTLLMLIWRTCFLLLCIDFFFKSPSVLWSDRMDDEIGSNLFDVSSKDMMSSVLYWPHKEGIEQLHEETLAVLWRRFLNCCK